MSRLLDAVRVRAATARHRGDAVRCPLCDHGFDRFKDDWNRPNALCWRCGAQERHRAQWLLFERRPQLLGDARSLLHFSPEWCLRRRLSALPGLRYVTTDLDPAQPADLRLDVTRARPARRRLRRGHLLARARARARRRRRDARAAPRHRAGRLHARHGAARAGPGDTYEDASITAPEDRRREFLQHDHVRLYAPDIADRLRAAGFAVEVVDMAAELGPDGAARHGLLASDLIFLCRPA